MKNRILNGWNVRRVVYLIVGLIATAQAFYLKEYFLILFGVYFAIMAVLNIGCASGHCAYEPPPRKPVVKDEQQ